MKAEMDTKWIDQFKDQNVLISLTNKFLLNPTILDDKIPWTKQTKSKMKHQQMCIFNRI